MPIVNIQILEGRSPQKKQALVRAVTEAVARSLEAPPSAIRVLLTEFAPAHWGVGGVTKAEEVA